LTNRERELNVSMNPSEGEEGGAAQEVAEKAGSNLEAMSKPEAIIAEVFSEVEEEDMENGTGEAALGRLRGGG